jgi:hypothetical protein
VASTQPGTARATAAAAITSSIALVYRLRFPYLRYIRGLPRRNLPLWWWARHVRRSDPRVARLSDAAYVGLQWSATLSQMAAQRSEAMLAREELPPPFTIAELSELEGVSTSTIRRKIALARQELFGALSDGGIYHRVHRDRERLSRARARPSCGAPGCTSVLPLTATKRRRFCHSRCRRRAAYWRSLDASVPDPERKGRASRAS